MTEIPTLTTDRLILRKIRTSDACDIFRNYAQNPSVTKFLSWRCHESIADTHAFVSRTLDELRAGDTLPWVIRTRGAPDVIGMLGVHIDGHKAMIGYVLAEESWGLGFMSEALRAVMSHLKESRPDLVRLWAFCDVANPASSRVMEKAGMTREGVLKSWALNPAGEPIDCPIYSWVRSAQALGSE